MKCVSEGCDAESYRRSLRCNQCKNSLYRYGLTGPERITLLEKQGGVCLLCEETLSFSGKYTACVDHDHGTGKIRGILCHNCNVWLGYMERKQLNVFKINAYIKPGSATG